MTHERAARGFLNSIPERFLRNTIHYFDIVKAIYPIYSLIIEELGGNVLQQIKVDFYLKKKKH